MMEGRFSFVVCFVICCVLCLSCACDPNPGGSRALPSPAGPGSSQPYLASDGERVYMSWLESQPDATSLRLASYDGAAWSTPSVVAAGVPLLVNWADFPSVLVTREGALAAQWLVSGDGESFAYDAFLGVSLDGGTSFGETHRLHGDEVSTEHGFVSLIDEPDGSIGMVWLDGRELPEKGTMQLRYRSFADGVLGPESLLDDDACTCCQTSATVVGEDVLVAYRDRRPGEIRDISLIRRDGSGWGEARTIHDDGWRIAACPVNGPAIAAHADDVALAWFSGADDRPRVLLAFSADGGESFGDPLVVESFGALGRVDLLALDDGEFAVAWLAARGDAGEVLLRRYRSDGEAGPLQVVGPARPGRKSGFPRMARLGRTIFVAWTEPGPSAELRLATVEF